MKNSVWYFAFEKRKLVLKKYPAKKLKIRKLSALAQPSEIKKIKRKKKK